MLEQGANTTHPVYGPGRIVSVLGERAMVDFFGDVLDVPTVELLVESRNLAPVSSGTLSVDRILLRRAYEAINLGVVPPNPDQLMAVSIGAANIDRSCRSWLDNANENGICKVFFGGYGSGKTHHLRFCEAVALKSGWAVSFVEFDPKQADPAKPHLVYRSILANLRFPSRSDGKMVGGFFDFLGEARKLYDRVSIGKYYKQSAWFAPTLASLRHLSHRPDPDYMSVVDWLGGQPVGFPTVQKIIRNSGSRSSSPKPMPRIKETADIYVFHLVVINEILKALGYKGLLLIFDEAEHVRGYTVPRKERANNFFDLLARSARAKDRYHVPPIPNDHGLDIPKYWLEGPHFGLLVGLTEGAALPEDSEQVREECVFLESRDDAIFLTAPEPEEYGEWCRQFLDQFYEHFPSEMHLIKAPLERQHLALLLSKRFAAQPVSERTLRLWTKLGSLAPSVLMANGAQTIAELHDVLDRAARATSRELMEWET